MGVNLPKLRAFMKREGHHLFDTIWNINLPEGVTVIKAELPIVVTVFGICTSLSLMHLLNACCPIVVTPSSMTTLSISDFLSSQGHPFTGTSIVEIRHFPLYRIS
mgnify:CR=1 FL=1